MTMETAAADLIIKNIQRAIAGSCLSCPDVVLNCILDEAMDLANKGYVWDVALAIACKLYPCTEFCAHYIFYELGTSNA